LHLAECRQGSCEQQFVQEALSSSVRNAKEMLDMMSKFTMEVFDKMSKNASQKCSFLHA
jgi:hypothetical protein